MSINTQQEQWVERIQNLFFQYGLKAVTMDEVARELGVSKKTLYQFVPSKKELVMMVVRAHIEMEKERCDTIRAATNGALEEMLAIIEAGVHDFRKVQSNMLYELQRHYRDCWNLLHEYATGFMLETVQDNLKRGIKEGIYRPDINIEITSRLHVAQAFSIFDAQWFPIGKTPFHEIMREYFSLYLHGLLTTHGRELLREKVG